MSDAVSDVPRRITGLLGVEVTIRTFTFAGELEVSATTPEKPLMLLTATLKTAWLGEIRVLFELEFGCIRKSPFDPKIERPTNTPAVANALATINTMISHAGIGLFRF